MFRCHNDNGELTFDVHGISVSGHADSAPKGKDLVCAAVSAVVVGGANAIKEFEKEDHKSVLTIKLKKGYASFQGKEDYHDILKTLYFMLKTIEESNPDFVKIKENYN